MTRRPCSSSSTTTTACSSIATTTTTTTTTCSSPSAVSPEKREGMRASLCQKTGPIWPASTAPEADWPRQAGARASWGILWRWSQPPLERRRRLAPPRHSALCALSLAPPARRLVLVRVRVRVRVGVRVRVRVRVSPPARHLVLVRGRVGVRVR
eukprot:scaffold26810_cov64-Phaeocystis_antarctica.AAC.1